MKKLKDEQQKLNLIHHEREAVAAELSKNVSGGITVSNIRQYNTYIVHLRQKAYIQENVVKQHSEIADKVREELIKAMQEKKILEELRDRQYFEFVKAVNRKEQMVTDELVSYKNAIRNRSAI